MPFFSTKFAYKGKELRIDIDDISLSVSNYENSEIIKTLTGENERSLLTDGSADRIYYLIKLRDQMMKNPQDFSGIDLNQTINSLNNILIAASKHPDIQRSLGFEEDNAKYTKDKNKLNQFAFIQKNLPTTGSAYKNINDAIDLLLKSGLPSKFKKNIEKTRKQLATSTLGETEKLLILAGCLTSVQTEMAQDNKSMRHSETIISILENNFKNHFNGNLYTDQYLQQQHSQFISAPSQQPIVVKDDMARFKDYLNFSITIGAIIIPKPSHIDAQTTAILNQLSRVNYDLSQSPDYSDPQKHMITAGMLYEVKALLSANSAQASIEICDKITNLLTTQYTAHGYNHQQAVQAYQNHQILFPDTQLSKAISQSSKAVLDASSSRIKAVATAQENPTFNHGDKSKDSLPQGPALLAKYHNLRDATYAMLETHKKQHLFNGLFMSKNKAASMDKIKNYLDHMEVLRTKPGAYDTGSAFTKELNGLLPLLLKESEQFSGSRYNNKEESQYKKHIETLLDKVLGPGSYAAAKNQYGLNTEVSKEVDTPSLHHSMGPEKG